MMITTTLIDASSSVDDVENGTDNTAGAILVLKNIGYYFMIAYFGYMSISLLASIPAVIQEYKIWSRYVYVTYRIRLVLFVLFTVRIYVNKRNQC